MVRYGVSWAATEHLTCEEIAIDLLMHKIAADPLEELPQAAQDGTVILRTGDKFCDEWEQQIQKTGSFNPFTTAADASKFQRFLDDNEKQATIADLLLSSKLKKFSAAK